MRCRIEKVGIVWTPDTRRVAQLHLTRVIDVVCHERAWENAVVRVVVRSVARLQMKLCRSALDAYAALKLKFAVLCVEHSVYGVHELPVCEIADASGVGSVRGAGGLKHSCVQSRVDALQ